MEALEDRLAPAFYSITSLADGAGTLDLGHAGTATDPYQDTTLRGAIAAATADHGNDTITIPSSQFTGLTLNGPPDTIQLNGSQLPTIVGQLTITGAIPDTSHRLDTLFTISAEENSRVFQVATTGNLTLNNLIIEKGSTTGNSATDKNGGGILNQGTLTLENVTLTGNSAASGAGIYNTGPSMLIEHSMIQGNTASVSGGGVWTSGANVTFNHDQITNNNVNGVDHSTDSASANPAIGGLVEGGGIDINGGAVSISFSTISGNTAQAGGGGPGNYGASPAGFTNAAAAGVNGAGGGAGGDGTQGGLGGQAQGGGISVDGGALSITTSTLSNNTAQGGPGGVGGAGGNGAGGQAGGSATHVGIGFSQGGIGGAGGAGGNGANGGAGGTAQGGALFLALDVTNLAMTDTTVAGNEAIGGQGGRSGAGGTGGKGGDGGEGTDPGAGGVGGAGGNGGTTGAPGSADGAGIHFDPSDNTRQIASSTIANNNVSRGADAQPITVTDKDFTFTIPAAGPKGGAGQGGLSGDGVTRASSGAIGQDGTFGAAQPADGGGLYENDAIFGVGLFKLTLTNSIVAANTQNTSTASDIYGTLALPGFSVANLIGTGGTGGLVNGTFENKVGVSAPGLMPLGNYGGETRTIALKGGSPAVDAGDNAYPFDASGTTPTTDQRGFPRISGGKVDIGAFELQQSFVVTTLQDNEIDDAGMGTSLRGAIELANTKSTPQTITFAPGLRGTITLTLGELQITNSMTIDGPGADQLSISGNNASRVLEVSNGSADVTIHGLSIINGGLFINAIPDDAGAGILNYANLTLDSVAVSKNIVSVVNGGGIYNFGNLTVIDSTISDNEAGGNGGGIDNLGSLSVINSTIADNAAGQDALGGGVFGGGNPSPIVLTNVTVAGNTDQRLSQSFQWVGVPDGVYNYYSTTTLANTIVADALGGAVTFNGINLVQGKTGTAGVISSDPKLGPLQDNGGPTPTMALLPGSPAIDAGNNSYAVDASSNPLQTDQNGFPRISGAKVDLGAYEMQPASLSPTPANGQQATPYNQTITATQPGYQASWGTLTFAVIDGSPPPGLSLSSAGVLSGIPTTAGPYDFTIEVSDLAGFGIQHDSITISPAPSPVVDTLADNFNYDYSAGHLSLREALYIAQLPGVTAPITFAPGLHGTIALTGGPLAITSGVTIQGPGANVLTIDAGGQSRVFSVGGGSADKVTISGLTITGGSAATGGGIWNADTLTLSDVVVTNNTGGGIENDQGNLYLIDSTVSNNTGANTGGGIDMSAGGALTAVNSTIADNTATYGGGIFSKAFLAIFGGQNVPATVTLTNVTVAGNSASLGAGVFNGDLSTLTLGNTIIGEDSGPEVSNHFDRSIANGSIIAVQGQNLVQGGLAGFPAVLSADPLLGPLQNNGGPTPTMALLPNSPAIDAGVNSFALDLSGNPLTTDQRGLPRIHGPAVDLGAFEVYGPAVVDTLADTSNGDYSPGHFSLREAVVIGASPITFAPGLHGTITLSQGPLAITGGLTIQGPGANVLTIDGGGHSNIFHIAGPSASHPITTSISGLTITKAGSGIYNTFDTLSLSDVVVTGNSADGIDNDLAFLHVLNSTISSNLGSGIVDTDGQVTLVGSTVANNQGDQNGNGGGISVYGTGGLMEATLTAVNTTIADNASLLGGGIYASGTIFGIVVPVLVTLTNVTVAGNIANDGAGIYNSTGSTLTLYNTIVGANIGAPDLTNDLTDRFFGGIGFTMALGANLVESVETVSNGVPQTVGGEFDANPPVISADPKLGPLQNNGGPTPTMALLPGSPAIDAGANSFALDLSGNPLQTDQNGFPRISGAKVDLGAYEVQPASLSPTLPSGTYGTAYSQTLTATQAGSQPSWGPFTFAVTAGTLPTGLNLSADGVLSGYPSAAGPFAFTVTASNLAGFGSQAYTMTIGPATPTLSVSDAGGTYNGHPYSATDSVAGVVTGVDTTPASTLEGVAPTLTYYQGTYTTLAALNTALAGGLTGSSTAPSVPGSYTVVASFAGSADYSSRQAIAPFTIKTPTTSITGPTIGVPGQPLTYSFAVTYGPNGPTKGITFSINYGDGTTLTTSAGGPSITLDHLYHTTSTFTIQVTAKDSNGVVSQLATQSVKISTVAMETDPSGGTALTVGGNAAGGDTITISATSTTGKTMDVTINKTDYGTFTPTGHIFVYGQGGKDTITLKAYKSSYIVVPAFLYGEGSGGDHISAAGSAANNVLSGHGANEVLTGGQGRDLLISGAGAASLTAGVGDDILIGGATNYDIGSNSGMTYAQQLAALDAIMSEWGSTDSYTMRLSALASYLNSNTVHDNSANGKPLADQLSGNALANDWFFAGVNDVVKGNSKSAVVTTIT
jgi:hypothetical protein